MARHSVEDRRRQSAIAAFGSFALRQPDLQKVLTEAARVCAISIDVPFSKVYRYRADKNDLLIEAGYGWRDGVVGVLTTVDMNSPQGRTFLTGKPSICNNLAAQIELDTSSLYARYGIVSTIDVVIKGSGDLVYGVLEIDNDKQHNYDQQDVDFLMSFSNVLAEAVSTSERTETMRTTIEQMKVLVKQKDELLAQKKVLSDELQHRVRSTAMSEMASTLAHELNQPLTAIASYLSGCTLIMDNHENGDFNALRAGFEGATRQAVRAGQIIRHLREFVAHGDNAKKLEDLMTLVLDASTLAFGIAHKAEVTLTYDLEKLPIFVMVDKVQIHQVIFNLLRNGIEAMLGTPGGELVIATSIKDGHMVEVSIADRGEGFADGEILELFKPIKSNKSSGMGVGLSICRTIIESHDGSLSAEDNPGGGAIFHFTLHIIDPAGLIDERK
jgi:signal transduction histidine kinase